MLGIVLWWTYECLHHMGLDNSARAETERVRADSERQAREAADAHGSRVETDRHGEIVAIDVDSGSWATAENARIALSASGSVVIQA